MRRTPVRRSVLLSTAGVCAVAVGAGALIATNSANAGSNTELTAFGVTAEELDRLQREKQDVAIENYTAWKAEQDRLAAEAAAAQAAAAAEAARVAAEAEAARLSAEAAAKADADRAAAASAATRSSSRSVAPAAPEAADEPAADVEYGSPREIGLQMVLARGWDEGQFSCLDKLFNKESGWNPTAKNSSSGAYGIPQSMPGNKMASHGSDWQTNPATQIAWGLDYISGRYGDPCSAWSHSQAKNWY